VSTPPGGRSMDHKVVGKKFVLQKVVTDHMLGRKRRRRKATSTCKQAKQK
jgi:hypothetical protein